MKRKFSLFLAAACLFTSISFAGVAHAASGSFTDVDSSTQYSEAIYTLTKLGIINGYPNDDNTTYSFKPNGDITRAEFAKIITVALGIADDTVAGSTDFVDVDGHWAKPYIITAAERTIVNGFEDKTFRPDENVTYEQAVKMIVCAAGYETVAQARGGWPNGYMAIAAETGVTANAFTTNQSGKVTRGVVAQLMDNVLDVNVFSLENGNMSTSGQEKTFMEQYLGIVKVSAKIVAVEDKNTNDYAGSLYPEEMAIMLKNGNVITLDYTTYTEDKAMLENYLGQEAVVFYREGKSGDMNTLFEIDFNSAKNTVTTVISENISSYSAGTLKYYDENHRTKTLKFDPAVASVFYNGKALTAGQMSYMSRLDPGDTDFIYGEVKLTDSGSDGIYDIVEITDYEMLIVARTPSTSDYVVSNKVKFVADPVKGYVIPSGYISSVTLDPDASGTTITITDASGKNVSITSLKANDVLLVAESLDSKIKTVKVTSSPVTGKISGTSDEGITINGKTYKISAYAEEYFKQNSIKTETSSQGTFYVDAYGTIVYATQAAVTQSTNPYVYIIRVIYDEDEDLGTVTAYVPSSSAVKTYNLSGKIRYNGATKTVSEVVDDLKDNMPANDGVTANVAVPDAGVCYSGGAVTLSNACQVARATIEGNYIKELIVAEPSEVGNYYKSVEDTMSIVPYTALSAKTKYTGSNNFDGKFYVNSSTTFIYVPQNRTENNKYAKKTASSFSSDTSYWVQPYNVNSSKVADLVLVYGKETETVVVKSTTHVSLLAKPLATKIEGDEEVYEVQYYSNSDSVTTKNASKTENCDPTSTNKYTPYDIGSLSVADFFRVGTDATLGLVNAECVLKYSDVKNAIDNNDCDFTSLEWTAFGNNYGHVLVANVVEVLELGEEGKYSLRVTNEGFDASGNISTSGESLIEVPSSAVIFRLTEDGKEVTPYKDGSDSEKITPADLREAKYEGRNASKIAIYSFSTTPDKGRTTKMILIYE